MAVVEDETRKQLAAGGEEQGFAFRTSFDPFNMIMQQLGKLDTKVDDLRKETDAKIGKLETKLDGLHKETEAKIGKLETKIDGLHKETEAKIGKLETKIDGLHKETETKIGKLETRIDRLETRIDKLETRIDRLDAKIDARVDGLQQEFRNSTRWIIGTIVAVAGVAIALASWLFQ